MSLNALTDLFLPRSEKNLELKGLEHKQDRQIHRQMQPNVLPQPHSWVVVTGAFLKYTTHHNIQPFNCIFQVYKMTWKRPWWWMTPSWSCSIDSNEYSVWISILPCLSSGNSSLKLSFSVRIYKHTTWYHTNTTTAGTVGCNVPIYTQYTVRVRVIGHCTAPYYGMKPLLETLRYGPC